MNGTWTVGQMRPQLANNGSPAIKNSTHTKFLSVREQAADKHPRRARLQP